MSHCSMFKRPDLLDGQKTIFFFEWTESVRLRCPSFSLSSVPYSSPWEGTTWRHIFPFRSNKGSFRSGSFLSHHFATSTMIPLPVRAKKYWVRPLVYQWHRTTSAVHPSSLSPWKPDWLILFDDFYWHRVHTTINLYLSFDNLSWIINPRW